MEQKINLLAGSVCFLAMARLQWPKQMIWQDNCVWGRVRFDPPWLYFCWPQMVLLGPFILLDFLLMNGWRESTINVASPAKLQCW